VGRRAFGFSFSGPQGQQNITPGSERSAACEGSIVQMLARIARLAWIKIGDTPPTCGYRLHTQFEILKGILHRTDATSANPKTPR
jgi:hypothetical protein